MQPPCEPPSLTTSPENSPWTDTRGFTLMELVVSSALLVIISALTFVAFSSASESVSLNKSMSDLQFDARNTVRALSEEIQQAVKRADAGLLLPTGAVELKIKDATHNSITYCVPTDMTGTAFSGLITIEFISEDLPDATEPGGEFGNARLDGGEDKNSDGRLTRRLTLTRNGATRDLGAAANLANVRFDLSNDGSTVTVTVVAVTRWRSGGKDRLLRYDTNSNIYLMN